MPDKTEDIYEQWREVMTYDADSLRAVALFLNKHKKNREFMKQASAEMGRNARNMARAVDYFKPFFTGEHTAVYIADDYLRLFAYAQLNRETAMELFKINKFDYPLYVIRERVAAAKPKRERKATLETRIAVKMVNALPDGDVPAEFARGIEYLKQKVCQEPEIERAIKKVLSI